MQCECVWARVDVRWVRTILHSRAVGVLYPRPATLIIAEILPFS